MKMSQIDCDAVWLKLDRANTGSLSQTQAQGVVSDFKTADANGDGKLSQLEFRQACDKGLVSSTAASGAGSGTPAGASGTGLSGTSPGSTK